MSEIWEIYSTFRSRDEALSVARELLEKKLIACANIHENVSSLYHWEGALREDKEAVLLAKTSAPKIKPAIDAVKHLHSYNLPCIIAYPIREGYLPYLQWVAREVTSSE